MKYNAATGLMCFASALVSMKKGGKVRQNSWEDDGKGYLHIVDGVIVDESGEEFMFEEASERLLDEEWQEAVVPL